MEKLIGYAGMSFKLTKSRYMDTVLKRGNMVKNFSFSVDSMITPSIAEKPVASQGKVFDCRLRGTVSVQGTIKKLEAWVFIIDKSGLPGRFKAWLYQHGILPRILWPLLVYELKMSNLKTMERKWGRRGFAARSLCKTYTY